MKETDYTPSEHLIGMRLDRFKLELPAIIERILQEIPQRNLRELVERLAMEANDIAPKRPERPHALIAYTMQLLARSLGLRGEKLAEVLAMTVAFVEAGDLYDDAVDGDYKEGHLHQLLAVSSTLHFVATRCALRLGPEVADGWLESMYDLPHSLLLEKDGDGSLGNYLTAIQAQAGLFGALGRVAAQASEVPDDQVVKIVELTKLLYGYLQLPQDLRNADEEVAAEERSTMAANILSHMSLDQARALFAQFHAQMVAALEGLPDNRDGKLLRELVETMQPA